MNDDQTSTPASGTSRRGFASMDPDFQRKVASAGGQAAHRKGTAHKWDSEAAREAGRKGGAARASRRAAVQDLNASLPDDPARVDASDLQVDPQAVAEQA